MAKPLKARIHELESRVADPKCEIHIDGLLVRLFDIIRRTSEETPSVLVHFLPTQLGTNNFLCQAFPL